MIFHYEARNKSGDILTGTVEAPTKAEASYRLYKKKLDIIRIGSRLGERKVRTRDLILFTRVLSNGVEAKIPLVKSLEITLQEIPVKSPLKKVVGAVLSNIRSGKSLSESLSLHPDIFSPFYISLVRSGERSGKLSRALVQVHTLLSKGYDIRRKVVSAAAYPLFVLVFGIIVLFFFSGVIIPRFQQSYREMGGDIPGFTRAVINVTGWFHSNWFWIIPLLVFAIFACYWWFKTDNGRTAWEKFLLSLPVAGDLVRKNAVVQFARAFSVMLAGGVTIPDSLELLKDVVPLRVFRSLIGEASAGLSEGRKLSDAFQKGSLFPPALVQMMGMGEESGKLGEMTGYLADFYEKELDASVERISSLLTPVLIVCIGLVIGIIAIALFLPIIEFSSLVK